MTIVRETAVEAIDRYLQLCEDRELSRAAEFWGDGPVRIELPGGPVFSSLADLAADARGRYAWVRKHRDRFLVGEGERPGSLWVTSIGRLYGENLAGAAFSDIRYVDVFVIRDGAIREQLVWNDLAVSGALLGGSADPRGV